MSDWVSVLVDMFDGHVTVLPAQTGETGDMLARCTVEGSHSRTSVTQLMGTSMHAAEHNFGCTWDEQKLKGKLKYTVIDPRQFDELWTRLGCTMNNWVKPEGYTSEDNPSIRDYFRTSDKPEKMTKSVSMIMNAGSDVNVLWSVCGKAEWGEKVFVVTWKTNGRVEIVDEKSGRIVLCMAQSHNGSQISFYCADVNCPVASSGRRRTKLRADQKVMAEEEYCGMRVFDDKKHVGTCLLLKPSILETLPVGLFAIASMYSKLL